MNSCRLGPSEIKFFLSGDRELFKRQLHDKPFLSSWKKESKKKSLPNKHELPHSFQELLWLGSGWLCITRFARQRPDETHLQTLQARHCSKSSKIYSYEKLRFWFSIKNFKKLTVSLTEKKCLGFKSRTRFMVAILNNTLHNAWFQSFSSALTSWLGILCVSFNSEGWAVGYVRIFFQRKRSWPSHLLE